MDPCRKVTLVLGASPNPERVSYEAVVSLLSRNIPVIAIGRREYTAENIIIQKTIPSEIPDLHTISLYLNASNQQDYYDSIISLKPKRIIFNPGTQNRKLAEMAILNGIEVVEGCMLMMLRSGEF
jgi:uncharacterized protein